MESKISIIVPIYNKEKYLVKNIESLVNQTYKNIEIILINDGSNDNSEIISLTYMAKDSRILYKKIKNSGVSVARNIGIEISTGKYCLFVDADDYLERNMIEYLVKKLEYTGSDLVISNIFKLENNTKKKLSFNIKLKKEKNYLLSEIISMNPVLLHSCGNKIFKNKILKEKNIKFFQNSHSYEDFNFVFKYCMYSKKNIIMDEALYNYVKNSSSITEENKLKNQSIKKIFKITCESLRTFKDIEEYMKNELKFKEYEREYTYKLSEAIILSQKSLLKNYVENQEISYIKLMYFSKKLEELYPRKKNIQLKIYIKILQIICIIFRDLIRKFLNYK